MRWKSKVHGGFLALIGFLLSPLSWWNDLFVNVPLALSFAWVVAWFYRPAFEAALIVGYWLTNLLGFVLMHKGAEKMLAHGETPPARSPGQWRKDVAISLLYTLIMAALIKLKVLQPLTEYYPVK